MRSQDSAAPSTPNPTRHKHTNKSSENTAEARCQLNEALQLSLI